MRDDDQARMKVKEMREEEMPQQETSIERVLYSDVLLSGGRTTAPEKHLRGTPHFSQLKHYFKTKKQKQNKNIK